MTREEFYNLTDILNSEVLGNFMHGGEADELIAMFEEAVEHSNILEQEETQNDDLEESAKNHAAERYRTTRDRELAEKCKWSFKAGAEWLKEHLWKDAQGDDLPTIDREVIALLDNGKVVYAHRPYKGKYIGKNLTTGNIETFENKVYDKGGWNQPDVKYWLDCFFPNIEED